MWMSLFGNSFNNREIASIIWLLIFLIWAIFQKDIRRSLFSLLRVFASKKILSIILFMFLYVFLIVCSLYWIRFWQFSMLKDTIIWLLSVAFLTLMNTTKVDENEHYFKDVIFDNLKLIVILEFIITSYVFNLAVELILMPFLALVIMLSTFAGTKKEYNLVKKIMDNILATIGFCFIVFALFNIAADFGGFANISNFRDFMLPPILTFSYLPFIYFIALCMKYETIFVRMDFFNLNKPINKFAKRKILTAFHFNLWKLNKFSIEVGIMKFDSKDDVQRTIQKFTAM